MLQRVMSRFSVENFLSHSAENFRKVILYCVTNAGIKKFYASEGYVTIFRRKVFCLTVPINFVGEPFSVSLISGIEKCYASEDYVTIFCRFFLSHFAKKFRRGTLLCCVSENFR